MLLVRQSSYQTEGHSLLLASDQHANKKKVKLL